MPRKKRRPQKEDRELRDLFVERYKRIKDERKLFLNTLIGLSGGTIVLSVTLLEKIAPKKYLLGLVIAAWCLLGLAILISIFGLVRMIWLSQKFQRELERALKDEEEFFPSMPIRPIRPLRFLRRTSGPPGSLFEAEYLSSFLFILGLLVLTGFAIVNLVSR